MAFEKAKVIKAAEKFLAQGKISAAIKEYRQIIDHDDSDLTTLNMLGDLLARAGEKEEAILCFQRIAEHYREKEFRLKAIAMYRKVEKLKPRDPAIAKELGDLYAAQGLIADARTQFLVVADAYTRAGDNRNTLKVLHRIADLDPNNTDIRLKLAQGYFKEQMLAEAAKAYSEAANRLLENSEFEKSLTAFSKTLELRPHDMVALKGLVIAHAALGTADEAAELLEKVVAETPDEPELISLLAQACIDAEDAAGAERATAMLMAEDASNYRRYIEVGFAYLKLGQEDEAARIVGIVIEPMLAAREENDLLELVNELLTRNSQHVASLRLMARIHWWQRDMEKLRAVLERLAESAETAGLAEDERYALTQLVRLAPEEHRYLDRLNVLGGVLESVTDVETQGDPARAPVPSFEGFAIEDTEANPPAAEGSEFEWNSVAEESQAHAEVSFADLNVTEAQAESESQGTDPFTKGFELAGHGPTTTEQRVDGKQGPSTKPMMQQELESVDFYITQNYIDIALDTLDLLERQFGPHPEITSRRESLQGKQAGPPAGSVGPVSESAEKRPSPKEDSEIDIAFGDIEIGQPLSGSEVGEGKDPAIGAPASIASGIDSGLAEIFEEFRMEAEGESASSKEDYETHYNMATAYKEMDLLDEAIREFQTATGLTTVGTQRYFQCCNMLGHCFVQKGMPQAAVFWFKKGLDSAGRSPEEHKALQYELGTAYEEMGELTEAVAAFTEVYGVDVSYRDIADKLESLQARVAETKKKKK